MSTLNGRTIAQIIDFAIGPSGGWDADVILESGAPIAKGERVTLKMLDVEAVGTVEKSALDAPSMPRVAFKGCAGWFAPTPQRGSYQSSELHLKDIIADLAALAGEPFDAPEDVILEGSFSWRKSTKRLPVSLSSVLTELVSRARLPTWRVTLAGRTRFDPWPALGAVDGKCQVLSRNAKLGKRAVALSSTAAVFLPGATIEGAAVRRVRFHEVSEKLTADIYTDDEIDPIATLREATMRAFPWLPYVGNHTFRLAARNADNTFDLEPIDEALAPLRRVPEHLIGGAYVKPIVGTLVVVVYRDNNPERPMIVQGSPLDLSVPDQIKFDARFIDLGAAAGTMVRDGDTVQVSPGNGSGPVSGILTITSGTAQVPPALSKVKG